MTLDEVREVLTTATWSRDVPLITLFNDLVEHCDDIPVTDWHGNTHPKRVTAAFELLTQPTASSGEIVALVLRMRGDAKMKLYERCWLRRARVEENEMKLDTYVAEKIEGLFENMATLVSAGGVSLDGFTADEYPAVVSALMLDVMPAAIEAASKSLTQACQPA